jgi:DNA-binding XRE family transcriptional regulator
MQTKNFERSGSFKFLNNEIRMYIDKNNPCSFQYYLNNFDFKTLRKIMSMNQKEFSVFLGISLRMVQRIEAKQYIGLNVLYKLKQVLGETTNQMMNLNLNIIKERRKNT